MSEPIDNVRTINRRAAQSGTVGYGAPVIIRDNSRTRVQFVPFFIPRSNGTELALKIITYKKSLRPRIGFSSRRNRYRLTSPKAVSFSPF
jgi:hypothetical protein